MKTTHADFSLPLLAALSLALSGCVADDAGSGLRRLDGFLASLAGECAAASEQINPNETPAAPSADPTDAAADAAPAADGAAFSLLRWDWGGFNGSKAAVADGCRISGLKVGKNIRYSWAEGGCEKLGAASATDASKTVCCLFCLGADGRWTGGKFDWISTSRTSRDLANIDSGYNGWDAAKFRAARAYAFCIVSADGRKRTNVITAEGTR